MNGRWWTLDGILYKSNGHKLVTIRSRNGHGTVTIAGGNWKIYCKVWLVSVFISFLRQFYFKMPHLAAFERIRLVDLYNYLQTHTENKLFLWWWKLNTALEFPPSAPIKVFIKKLHQNFHKMFKKVTVKMSQTKTKSFLFIF